MKRTTLDQLKITINGAPATSEELKQFSVNTFLVHSRVLLEDPGYGSGFPAYRFWFQVPVKPGDTVEFTFENMGYTAAKCMLNGEPVSPVRKDRVPGEI